ncbi:MAG: hypothetical protein L0H96_01110 [Humibacillus sp.]|nr:hypothetical protein [Humibacillus sp.]MDN5775495.1 hypothetical protein [Humibacillus sp.]
MSFDLDAGMIRELLDELGRRLADADVAAAVYVVGGAAISLRAFLIRVGERKTSTPSRATTG